MRGSLLSIGHCLLGPPGRRRMRVQQTLLGMPALLLMQVLLLVEHQVGGAPLTPLGWYALLSWIGCAVFYGLVRSGWSERLSAEASLSLPQMAFAMGCVAWAYWLAGPLRPALLLLMPLALSFGIFALDDRRVRTLSGLAIVGVGGVVGLRLPRQPAWPDVALDLAMWLFMAVTLASIGVLARRMARMRERLRAQKSELRDALERIQLLATRDALTGLLNRRAMMERLQVMARSQQPLTLALADLDRFKQINDEHGHAVGDRVLQTFGLHAQQLFGEAGLVARWGGEEFLFALPGADETLLRMLLEQLRSHLAGRAHEGLPVSVRIGFSAGVAPCRALVELEVPAVPAQAGVPICSIGDIFRLLCADLRGQSRSHLAPSLVREIRMAQFLGVSYCQVTAECCTCFKALVAYKSPSPAPLPESQTKSYWNHPLPGVDSHPRPLPKSNPTLMSHLRCPNGCDGPASVKWECSGTLDDGTGQAKLYAERDTARLLLGMSASMTKRIELGVLHHPRGTMVFSRGVPPRADLRAAVAARRNSLVLAMVIRRIAG
ncbi:MAG: GGDEF domain-containing protein [Burkholderiales bacterium]|nr:GGDEF domain-containing protein [Burkholderiales bacterium]